MTQSKYSTAHAVVSLPAASLGMDLRWLDVNEPLPNPVALPARGRTIWWLAAGGGLPIVTAALLPTLRFV
ncbi:MAG: hypothetical protein ACFLMY_17880 [Candidatus Brachytrichaceae bacterium NZ_4S206]|jgi:hypothetical protein